MKISHTFEGTVCSVYAEGQFALESVSTVKAYLQPLVNDQNLQTLLFDFAQVCFIDSSGVGLVVMTAMRLKQRGAGFALINVNQETQEIFLLCGLKDQIGIFGSKAEALAALAA